MSNPTNFVASLDGSLAYTDRSGSGLLAGAGPERYSAGLWLEEATVNIVSNPSFEVNTAGWSTDNAVLTRQTSWSSSGSASGRLRRNTVVDLIDTYMFTGSASVAAGESITVGIDLNPSVVMASLRMSIIWKTAANATISTVKGATFGGGPGALARQTLSAVAPATTDKVQFVLTHLVAGGTLTDDLFIDAVQIEKKPYATSYTDTTRAASSASIDPAGILDPTSGAVAFRVTPTIETGVEEIWGECGVKGAGTDHLRWGRDASTHPFVEWSANNAAYQRLTGSETLSAGTAYDLYFGWNGTAIELAVDAGTLQTDTRDAVEGDFSTGDLTLEASAGGVIYQPFATFNRTLTAKEIATLNGKNNWTMNVLTGNPYINFQLRPY